MGLYCDVCYGELNHTVVSCIHTVVVCVDGGRGGGSCKGIGITCKGDIMQHGV